MSRGQPTARASAGRSPYLSFREAVRPAIFAHRLLLEESERVERLSLQEKERAGALAESATQILGLTRDLLKRAGLGYIAGAGSGTQTGAADRLGRQGSVLDAFADAAMFWSQIAGNCLAIADQLLSQGRLDEVRSLAAALADSGEPGTAEELHRQLTRATWQKYEKSLEAIHGRMTPAETERALALLSEAMSEIPESPDRNIWLKSFLPPLAKSALLGTTKERKELDYDLRNRIEWIAGGDTKRERIAYHISDIAAVFRITKKPD